MQGYLFATRDEKPQPAGPRQATLAFTSWVDPGRRGDPDPDWIVAVLSQTDGKPSLVELQSMWNRRLHVVKAVAEWRASALMRTIAEDAVRQTRALRDRPADAPPAPVMLALPAPDSPAYRVRKLHSEGASLRSIATLTGVPLTTVRRMVGKV